MEQPVERVPRYSRRLRFGHLVAILKALGLAWLAREIWRDIHRGDSPLPPTDAEAGSTPRPSEVERHLGFQAFWNARREAIKEGLSVREMVERLCSNYVTSYPNEADTTVPDGEIE